MTSLADEVLARHVLYREWHQSCALCQLAWPCDAARTATALAAAQATLDTVAAERDALAGALRHIAECPGAPNAPLDPDWHVSLIRHLQAAATNALAAASPAEKEPPR